jgi:hypothetical protein
MKPSEKPRPPGYDDYKNDHLAKWPMNLIELRRKDYEQRVRIDAEELAHLRDSSIVREIHHHARREIEIAMHTSIYGIDHPQRHVIRFPENWWEAVKERFAPSWFRDRHPVRFTEVTASLEETYPDFQPALPDRKPVMKFAVMRKPQTPIW